MKGSRAFAMWIALALAPQGGAAQVGTDAGAPVSDEPGESMAAGEAKIREPERGREELKRIVDEAIYDKVFFPTKDGKIVGDVPGAIVAVVSGSTVLSLPYGCARINGTEYTDTTEDTQFRVGSLSKLFATTALLQLIEKELLVPNERDVEKVLKMEVNDFLKDEGEDDLRIPDHPGYPQVTLENLLTHTAGFEERQIGMERRSSDPERTLREYLIENRPARVRPPVTDFGDGQKKASIGADEASYSSWGMALAGYLVAKYSKEKSFEDHVQEHIIRELEMSDSTTFDEPAQENLWEAQMARGHSHRGPLLSWPPVESPRPRVGCPPHGKDGSHGFVPQDFEYLSAAGPAVGLRTTAPDMAKFMVDHLNKGAKLFDDPKTAEAMHRPRLIPDLYPGFNAGALGFYQQHRRGLPTLVHSGNTIGFSSKLVLVPGAQFGIFVAVNTRLRDLYLDNFIKAVITKALVTALLPAQVPGSDPPAAPGSSSAAAASPVADAPKAYDPADIVGHYFANPHAYRAAEKFMFVTVNLSTIEVGYEPDGRLLVRGLLIAPKTRWKPLGANLFRLLGKDDVPQDELIRFQCDADGRMRMLGPLPYWPAYKLERWEQPTFHRQLHTVAVGIFLAALLWPLIVAFRAGGPGWPFARGLAVALALSNLIALLVLKARFADPYQLIFGYDYAVKAALFLLLLSVPLVVAVAVCAVWSWVKSAWPLPGRVAYTVFAIVAVIFLWSMCHWGLIGFEWL